MKHKMNRKVFIVKKCNQFHHFLRRYSLLIISQQSILISSDKLTVSQHKENPSYWRRRRIFVAKKEVDCEAKGLFRFIEHPTLLLSHSQFFLQTYIKKGFCLWNRYYLHVCERWWLLCAYIIINTSYYQHTCIQTINIVIQFLVIFLCALFISIPHICKPE